MLKLHPELLQEKKIAIKLLTITRLAALYVIALLQLHIVFTWNKKKTQKNDIFKLCFCFFKFVDFKDFINGYTALHWAAKHGNIEIIKLLAGKHQADVNIKSYGG